MGIPNILGFICVTGLAFVLSWVVPIASKPGLLALMDVLSGIASVFAGVWTCRLIGFEPHAWLPMVAGVWFGVHFALQERYAEFVRAVMGVFVGWMLYPAAR